MSSVMAAVKGDEIVPVDLAEACRAARGTPDRYRDAAWYFA
jgi:hypothetical protein